MMRWLTVALGATVVLLLFADFLAFHDLFEPHTGTDWIGPCRLGLGRRLPRPGDRPVG